MGSNVRQVTAAEYQQVLTAVDTEFAAGIQQVATGRNPAPLTSALQELLTVSATHMATLRDLAPPEPATAAHEAVSDALSDLLGVLTATLSEVRSTRVCTGSSALTKVTSSPAATAVRAAAQALAVADPAHPYKVGAFLPAAIAEQSRKLANGTMVKAGSRNGSGKLTIENTTTRDAVVNVVTAGGKAVVMTVYVTAGGTFTVTGVRDGTYEIFISQGVDWDSGAAAFSRDCAFQRFEDKFEFTTTSRATTQWTIGLQRVPDGNAQVGDVAPGDFPT